MQSWREESRSGVIISNIWYMPTETAGLLGVFFFCCSIHMEYSKNNILLQRFYNPM